MAFTDPLPAYGDAGGPSGWSAKVIAALTDLEANAYKFPSGGIPEADLAAAVQAKLDAVNSYYLKPNLGIPSTDLTTAVQNALTAAGTAYQKPGTGIPESALDSATQAKLDVSGNAYTKPGSGIPASDLASAVQSQLNAANGLSASVTSAQTAAALALQGRVSGSMSLGVLVRDSAPQTLYSTQNPAAESVASVGKTFVVYLGPKRDLFARSIDNVTGAVSSPVRVGAYGIGTIDDTHGAPTLCADLTNNVLIAVYGSHGDSTSTPSDGYMTIARSGANFDYTTWTVQRLSSIQGTYGSICYEPVSGACYIAFRSGNSHSTSGAYQSHEECSILRSTNGGASWTDLGASPGGMINTHVAFPGDVCTDYYGSDCDATPGKVWLSWAIAHGPKHDGPRANVYVAYYDTATSQMKNAAGTVVGSPKISTLANMELCRIAPAQDYVYPIHTAPAVVGGVVQILTTYNRYDSTTNLVHIMAAFWNGTAWTVTDTGMTSNYLYNGLVPAYRASRWEIVGITNVLGDPILAQTSDKTTLGGATGGGDVFLLTSPDGTTFTLDQVWPRDSFGSAAQFVQSVRNASPTACYLIQRIDYSTIANTIGGTVDTSSTQSDYNTATWESPLHVISATVDVPRGRDAHILPPVKHWINPFYQLWYQSAPPTSWNTLDLSVLPRGVTEVTLRVSAVGSGTSGGYILYFREGLTTRADDAIVSFRGEWTDAMAYDVTVPLSTDRTLVWRASAALGNVTIYPRAFKVAARTAAYVPPSAPTAMTISGTVGNGQVTVSVSGATGASSYALYQSSTVTGSPVATTFPATITGLTNGTAYSFIATATNAGGTVTSAPISLTPSVPVTSFADSFTRTGTTTGNGWTAFGAATWPTNGAQLGIAGTSTTTTTYGNIAGFAAASSTAIFAQFDVAAVGAGAPTPWHPLPIVNYTDPNNYYYGGFVPVSGSTTTGTWSISEFSGGTSSNLFTGDVVAVPSLPYTVKLTQVNGTLYLSVNGTVVGTATDSSPLTGTGAGIRLRGVNAGSAGTGVETALMDNFSAGTGTAPATVPTALTISAVPGSGQVTISASGGTGATSYALYQSSTVTGSPVATAFPATITGLTNGTAYNFIATATNTAGTVTSALISATPVASSGAASFTDAFGRTASTAGSNWTANGAATWPTNGTQMGIAGTSTSAVTTYLNIPVFAASNPANIFAQVDVAAIGSGATSPVHPAAVINYTDISNYYYGGFVAVTGSTTTGNWSIYKNVAGTVTLVTSSAVVSVPSFPYTVELTRVGTTITLYLNGTSVASYTDGGTVLSGAGVGLRYRGGGTNSGAATISEGVKVDNFSAGQAV